MLAQLLKRFSTKGEGVARTASNKSTSSKKAAGKSKAASPAQKRAAEQAAPAPAKPQIFDERTKRDIAGVAVTLLGIVLFVAAVVPTDALITSFVSQLLHLCLGIGAYLLPFFLVAIGASCLVRIDKEGIPLRASVGSAMLFVAVLSLLALFTPEAAPDATDNLFLADQLSARGGYIGAGVAWCGLTLFGKVISAIVLFGLAIAGLIVIGFSVSSIVEKLRALAAAREEAEEREHGVVPAPAFARVSRPKAKAVDEPELAELETAKTQMLKQPSASNRRHGSAVASSDDGASREDASKAPETITRKLGRRKPIERAAAPAMPKKPSKAATPVATPRPEQGFELPPFDLLAMSTDPEKDSGNRFGAAGNRRLPAGNA